MREMDYGGMADGGTTTFEEQGPSVWLVWSQLPVESPNVAVIHLGSLLNTESFRHSPRPAKVPSSELGPRNPYFKDSPWVIPTHTKVEDPPVYRRL